MPTTVIRTIGSGGDFPTLSAWWAFLPPSLVAVDEEHFAHLLNQEHTDIPVFSGKTVDATRRIVITAAPGASWTDFPGSPLRYGYGARITRTSEFSPAYKCEGGQEIWMTRIQLRNTGQGGGIDTINFDGAIRGLDRVLIESPCQSLATVATLDGLSQPKQCVFIQTGAAGINGVVFARTPMYGCLVVLLNGTNSAGITSEFETGQVIRNCGVFGVTPLAGSSTFNVSGCATDQASPPSGFTQHAFSTSAGARFENITLGSHDFRLKAGSSLAGAGVVDTINSAADAYGTARGNPPTIGPMEIAAPVPVITGPTGAAGAASIATSSAENQNILGVWTATNSVGWSLSGPDAGQLTISGGTVTKTSGNLDFEAKPTWNFTVDNGSASQAVTHSVTNINEPPTFIGPAIGALVLTVGVPITPVPLATRFVDPEGLAITATIVEALPAGLSVVSGQLQGTPTATQSAASYTPRGADPANNGANGTAFTIAIGSTPPPVRTVRTLPFSRNPGNGARPVSLPNNSVAVLADAAGLAPIVNQAGLAMGSDGRVQLDSSSLPASGTSVVVVTREADGKLGVERYQVQ
jgi:hypothetical protein